MKMNVKVPLGVLLLLAITLGYVLGTENGRAQRDVILVKLGRKKDDEPEAAADEESA
jgi:hypothetical protein